MAIFHLSLKTISRSKGQSAIASSAYRSGERLVDEETGEIKDFTNKQGVAYSEIQLPENAPQEYEDRQTLWNAVQVIESKSNSQLAREVEVALPIELERKQQIQLVHDYVQENFVEQGMCADWSIHDKKDGNPHAHIMLTTRSLSFNGQWLAKQKSTYLLDEKGEKVPQIDSKTGKQKIGARGRKMWQRTTIATNDWNNRENADTWRANWAKSCNQYLELDQQVDHRSYKRQGKEQIPTIHEGYVARKMGAKSERVQENQQITAKNGKVAELQAELSQIQQHLQQLIQRMQEAIHERIKRARLKRVDNGIRGVEPRKSANAGTDEEANISEREAQRRKSELERQNREAERSGQNTKTKSTARNSQQPFIPSNDFNARRGRSR